MLPVRTFARKAAFLAEAAELRPTGSGLVRRRCVVDVKARSLRVTTCRQYYRTRVTIPSDILNDPRSELQTCPNVVEPNPSLVEANPKLVEVNPKLVELTFLFWPPKS